MKNKKFGIKEVIDIRFYNATTGEEVLDTRDIEPVKEEFNPNIPIIDLVKSVSPGYDICNHPLIRKYGYDTFGSIYERWYWNDNLSEASEEELWKIYALINTSSLVNYYYWYRKEVYEFRKYKKENVKQK